MISKIDACREILTLQVFVQNLQASDLEPDAVYHAIYSPDVSRRVFAIGDAHSEFEVHLWLDTSYEEEIVEFAHELDRIAAIARKILECMPPGMRGDFAP